MFGLSQRGFTKDNIDPTKQCLRTHISGLLLKDNCSAEQLGGNSTDGTGVLGISRNFCELEILAFSKLMSLQARASSSKSRSARVQLEVQEPFQLETLHDAR